MGASKTQQYTDAEIQAAIVANALSHPARIRILNVIQRRDFVRNVDLELELKLVKSSVHAHIKMLKLAKLIEIDFVSNSYRITPVNDLSERLSNHLNEINEFES